MPLSATTAAWARSLPLWVSVALVVLLAWQVIQLAWTLLGAGRAPVTDPAAAAPVQVPTGPAIDVGAIPVEAVDRVEVVTDGASAIYGSDAVGGVGNVILKRDFEGVQVGARYGRATDGGLATREYTVTIIADGTPPVIDYTLTALSVGNNGWYVGDVIITWSVVDTESLAVVDAGCGIGFVDTLASDTAAGWFYSEIDDTEIAGGGS